MEKGERVGPYGNNKASASAIAFDKKCAQCLKVSLLLRMKTNPEFKGIWKKKNQEINLISSANRSMDVQLSVSGKLQDGWHCRGGIQPNPKTTVGDQ